MKLFPDTWRFYAEPDKSKGAPAEEDAVVEEKEVVDEEAEEVEEEPETTLEEDANALRNREEDEINQKAIDEGDEQAKEDIADLLSLNDDEKKAAEEEQKEEKVEDKSVKEDGKEEKEEEVEEKEEEEDPLLAELGRLTAIATGAEVAPTPKPKGEEKEETPVVDTKQQVDDELIKAMTTPVEMEDVQYVTSEMYKETLDDTDRKQLNTTLNQVVKRVREDTRNQTMQDAMKVFPAMMDYKMQGFLAAQEFWNRNPDIKTFCDKYPQVKQYVQFRSTEIQRQNPNAPLSEVFTKTEKEVRTILKGRLDRLKAQADSEGGSVARTPGLVRKPGASRKTPVPTTRKNKTEQEEIMELMNFD